MGEAVTRWRASRPSSPISQSRWAKISNLMGSSGVLEVWMALALLAVRVGGTIGRGERHCSGLTRRVKRRLLDSKNASSYDAGT